jgi:indole-3-glycerol phosphate synthase/phosphoribosylanthranilate isomerase
MEQTMADTFLERIVASTRKEVAARRARVPLEEMHERAASAAVPRDFADALRPPPDGSARLIAEVKRASPSKGLLAERFEPVEQARAYETGGAAAISVLTEPHFFLGALEHLSAVRAAVRVPVLRKDFILDEYQVYEARVAGADAVLLICAMLDDETISRYLALAHTLGMEALVEAHNAEETQRAVASGARVIGVNSRDLRTFAVDPDVVRHLRPLVPADRIFIAESGITDARGAAHARAWGADAILAGETLMRADAPAVKARELATAPGGAMARFFAWTGNPFVKICGLAEPAHAALARDLGADAYGLVFAPMAPAHRLLTAERAEAVVRAIHSDACASDGEGSRPIKAVGIFVNETPEAIAAIMERVGLDAVQLSGDEPPETCAAVAERTGLPTLKALRLRTEADLDALDTYALAGVTLLLDAHVSGYYGGTGQTGDWVLARRAAARWPVILSGGLSPENVAEAILAVHPRGVDVSSGVETARAKDAAKIQAFIRAAKAAETASTIPYTEASV